jgi:type IV pilus assembly protein PilA
MLSSSKKRNLLEKGFTLIELMIVIVIVGILSAVAIPNFLNQTTKAKATEAKSDISAIIKNASAEFTTGGATYVGTLIGANAAASCDNMGGRPAAKTTKFDYTCSIDSTTNDLTVTATGDGNDTGIQDKMITQEANLEDGSVTLIKDKTCQVFGGTKTDGGCA